MDANWWCVSLEVWIYMMCNTWIWLVMTMVEINPSDWMVIGRTLVLIMNEYYKIHPN